MTCFAADKFFTSADHGCGGPADPIELLVRLINYLAQ